MVSHLQNHFPAMYKLYSIFTARKTPPTPIELLIATNSSKIDQKDVNDYLQSMDVPAQNTIQNAFDCQMAVC
jgi:hypothetical protein